MPETATEPTLPDADDLEYDVEAAIAACDGDARAAVRSLLVVNSTQEHRIASLENRAAGRHRLRWLHTRQAARAAHEMSGNARIFRRGSYQTGSAGLSPD